MRDSEKKSRGFGFVTMSSIEETDSVVMAKDEDNDECHKINGKKVEVKRAIPKVSSIYLTSRIPNQPSEHFDNLSTE